MYYEKVKEVEDYIIGLRRHFHQYPEMTGKEFETVKKIREELEKLGIEYIEVENGGVLGFIKGNKEGDRKVLLRADIDALPVDEKTENLKGPRTCHSKNDGFMHACGHDGHMSMLLGAAKVLVGEKDNFGGEIILCFERGEEGSWNYRELLSYMEREGIVPDTAWGVHVKNDIETGKIGIAEGAMMAGPFFFDVTIEGQGGHGARPDESKSPITAFNAIYNSLEGIRVEKVSPFEVLVYSIGSVTSGHVPNVIPQKLNFKGTARYLNREKAGNPFHDEFKKSIEMICEMHGCKPEYHLFPKPGFPTVNNKEAALYAREVLTEELGEGVVIDPEPWMASESFAAYQNQWPSVFAFVGIKNDEKGTGAPHHNEYFDIDEDALVLGATGAVTYAMNYLNSDVEFPEQPYKGRYKDYLRESGFSEEDIKGYYSVGEVE